MTLFLIAVIIFIIYTIYESAKRTEKYNKRVKDTTSNAKEQYEIACGIIEDMAENYRYYVAQMDADEYFYLKDHPFEKQRPAKLDKWYEKHGSYGSFKHLTVYDRNYLEQYTSGSFYERNIKKDKTPCGSSDFERMWLISAGILLGLDMEDVRVPEKVYNSKLWEILPEDASAITVQQWKKQHPEFQGGKARFTMTLETAIKARKLLKTGYDTTQHPFKYDNAYWDYQVLPVVEKVSEEYGLPTNEELKAMHSYFTRYSNIPELAILYSRRAIYRKGFCPVLLNKIKANPSPELIKAISGIKTKSEAWRSEIERTAELKKKYPDIH